MGKRHQKLRSPQKGQARFQARFLPSLQYWLQALHSTSSFRSPHPDWVAPYDLTTIRSVLRVLANRTSVFDLLTDSDVTSINAAAQDEQQQPHPDEPLHSPITPSG